MDILVDVVNQRLQTATNLTSFIAGTQEFIRFVFNLDDDWDNLLTFAQFTQDGESYNQYLDNDNGAYLPSEIGVGTCTLSLYGSADNKRATTNFLTLKIEENNFVEDGNSTSITLSLYEQLANEVHTLSVFKDQFKADFAAGDAALQTQINTKANQLDLAAEISRATTAEQTNAAAILRKADQSQVDQIASEVTKLSNNETVANAISESVSEEIAKYIANGTLANMSIADGSINRDKLNDDLKGSLNKADTAVQAGEQYPSLTTADSIYLAAKAASDTVDRRVDDVVSEIQDAYNVDSTHIYNNLGDSVRGVLSQARLYTQTYVQGALIDYKAFTIKIVDELPERGESMTFYLVPNNSNTGYDKYWWIIDNNNIPKWDVFGSSSTLVVNVLPDTGDSDVDYILKTSSGCLYYKWIDGAWQVVAGSIAKVSSSLPEVGNEYTDYYVLNDSGVYVHYRYINGVFHSIGTETYTSGEIDTLVATLSDRVDGAVADIQTNQTNITSLSRTIDKVAQDLNNLDVEGYTYSATISQNDSGNYIYTLIETKDNVDTIKSQFVLPSGGGGGGTTTTTNLVVERITESPIITTTTDSVLIEVDYSSTDGDGELVDGTYILRSGTNTIMSGALVQGRNTFDITEYCSIGTQKFTLTVTDEGGSVNVKTWTVQIVDVRLESSFNDRYTYSIGKSVNFTYTPYGSISKTVHFKLDGVELESVTTTASGTLQSYSLPAQSHGSHLLECYMTATVNSKQIETEHIFKDIIWFDENSDVPVIGCIYRYDYYGNLNARQYNTTSIPYIVFDPKTSTPTVSLSIDGGTVSTLRLSTSTNTWAYKSEEVGEHTLVITCRTTSVIIKPNIQELGYNIAPITANLDFDFNPVGLSNSSTNRLWQDTNNSDIKLTVSDNFDWSNGGYQLDENGNQYFCVKSGTRAYINYNLFAIDPKQAGAEFKIIFKTENVRDNTTTFLSCMPEDTVKVGLKMNAHEAYVYSSTDNLYTPYSEEDVIEYEYNILPLNTEVENSTSYVMSYEDGVAARPMIYDSSHRLYQYQAVPITIGSDDCDVHIYRMKSYSSSLTDSNILSNFIADSMDSDTMIERYERNQIYNENNALTPESVANACPDLKIIKIECPHFTNDKKDYVKNTNVECIHKNGDPILDNWKFTNGYHAGQGTTSNEYGFAGRNIDIIFGFDGQHQVTSKIPLDTSYITELTLGDGTKYSDGSGKVSLTRNSVPNNWFNIKVNIASSENANNALLQKRYNDYLPYKTPAMKRDSKTKNSMEFCNCVIFIKESDSDVTTHREFADTNWHFYGIGNLGDSKKTDSTRVNDPTDLKEFVVEVSDNTLPNSWFQTGVYKDSNGEITYNPEESVEMVYPITTEQWKNENNLKRQSLYNAWDDSFEFRYDMGTKDGETITSAEIDEQQELSKQVWRDMYEFVITSSNSDFVSHFGDWFISESPLYWYLFTERYTMIDNRAKNTFWHWGKTYITTVEAEEMGNDAQYYTIDDTAARINNGYRFDLWDYDNDTALGINNSGELTMTYGHEDIDYKTPNDPSSGYIFNAAENIFWRRIRTLMHSQLQSMYLSRESLNCWSATSLIAEFDKWQSQFPEELWRLDIERKYLRTYQAGTVRFLNEMMNGRKKYQRRQFERDQEAYIGTKYVGTNVKSDQIMFRCNTPKTGVVVQPDYTLKIVPYSDMYLTVLYGNSPSPQQIRAKAGQEYEITTNLTEMDDTAILIYCASRIQALNDLSACYIHDNDFSKASKLKTLIIGNTTEGYSNTFLTSLNMGNNTLLETLDVRNCPNLSGSINLSACPNLINLYAEGTVITSVSFANNGKVVKAHLPQTINGLTLRNLNYLTDLQVVSYANLETFVCEYSVVDALSILQAAQNTLQTVKVLGINWVLADTALLNKILSMNSSLLGGFVYISGAIRNQELLNYANAWSDLEVTYNPQNLVAQYLATYVNADGTVLYELYVDRGSAPPDIISLGLIDTPTKESTAQYTFTYSGWDDITSVMLAPRTITAEYTETIRSYTVTWYSRAGLSLGSTTANYGDEVVYESDTPTNTSQENSYVYNVFSGWNKSTGYITGDTDVYAIWENAALPSTSKDLKDMSPAEVYGVTSSGQVDDYFAQKDYIDITLGHDFNFTNVNSEVIAQETYLDGTTPIRTNITLFGENSPSFTLAVDFRFTDTANTNNTLLACFDESGNKGFRLRMNNNPDIQWGDKNVNVGYQDYRDIVVLRHRAGENKLYVYSSNGTSSSFANAISSSELTRATTPDTEQKLVLGGVYYEGDGGYGDKGSGYIYWAKVWYDDLGDTNARALAAWTHETLRFENCTTNIGTNKGRYALAGNTSQRASMSFISNACLVDRLKVMNSSNTNVGGWDSSAMRTFMNARLPNALPTVWRSLLKKVKISATEGNKSTNVLVSEDWFYLPCLREMGGSNDSPYNAEGVIISWFTSDIRRAKFRGKIIPDDATYYTNSSDPSLDSNVTIKSGDVWEQNGNSPCYIYATDEEVRYYGLSKSVAANIGGYWVSACNYWERSPNVGNTYNFWDVGNGGYNYYNLANNSYGVCPCFSI